MFEGSRKTAGLAILVTAALTATTMPTFAHSAAYCRDYARSAASDTGFNPVWIIPLAAIGAGAGALVGVAASGVAVSTGAIVGGASGGAVGVVGATSSYQHNYNAAYADCRAGRI
jgi:hypothetical protein